MIRLASVHALQCNARPLDWTQSSQCKHQRLHLDFDNAPRGQLHPQFPGERLAWFQHHGRANYLSRSKITIILRRRQKPYEITD